ncbi:DedA family protein [Rheinheimera sp.]|uniref:DedA family protein n=1 Tax=Rheinheimera sp. TaxID=1869214 RepID=UPI00307F95F7
MEQYLHQLLDQYQHLALLILFGLVFFESVAVLGLLLPGTALMFSFGLLIGSGQIGFWQACLVGAAAGILGDGLSYLAGRHFRPQLERWSWLAKQQKQLDKVRAMLDKSVWLAIIAGRFIGPSRPLLPLLAGMLQLAPARYFPASILACCLFPVAYFLPGILAGVAWQLKGTNLSWFYLLLAGSIVLALLSAWLITRYLGSTEPEEKPRQPWFWSSLLSALLTAFCLFELSQHPATPIYLKQLSGLMF